MALEYFEHGTVVSQSDITAIQAFYMTEDEQYVHHVLTLKDGRKAVVGGDLTNGSTEFAESIYESSTTADEIIEEYRRDW